MSYTYKEVSINGMGNYHVFTDQFSEGNLPSETTWNSMSQELNSGTTQESTGLSLRNGAQPPTNPMPVAGSVIPFVLISVVYILLLSRRIKREKAK